MNVNDVKFGNHRPDQLRASSTERAAKTKADAKADVSSDQKAASVGDRVEISNRGREVSGRQDELKREVEFARRAMYSSPPLSKDRAEKILRQLEQDHYNAPDVHIKLSQMLSQELTPRSAEAGGVAKGENGA